MKKNEVTKKWRFSSVSAWKQGKWVKPSTKIRANKHLSSRTAFLHTSGKCRLILAKSHKFCTSYSHYVENSEKFSQAMWKTVVFLWKQKRNAPSSGRSSRFPHKHKLSAGFGAWLISFLYYIIVPASDFRTCRRFIFVWFKKYIRRWSAWRWRSSPRRVLMRRFTDSAPGWLPQAEGKCFRRDVQKAEKF